jgi:hypothetical protein
VPFKFSIFLISRIPRISRFELLFSGVTALFFCLHFSACGLLKPDRLIRLAALRAAGAIDIGVVCVNIAATAATEDPIFARSRLESASPQLRVDRHARQSAEQDHHIG